MQISRCEKQSFCFSDQSWFFPTIFAHCKQTHHPNTMVFGTDVTSISHNNGIDNNGREARSLFLSARSLVWQKRDKKKTKILKTSCGKVLSICLLRRIVSSIVFSDEVLPSVKVPHPKVHPESAVAQFQPLYKEKPFLSLLYRRRQNLKNLRP